eukprot:TRINITY_DN108532_c0_g1_i1.p1 TRINITY_DN108532_c0_g1~~TRINITY_DN108532_c0_g1_i1.p1  ORF type:complete len:271 (+),score=44.89 TRINITY_DN108532_c0_g1_i1:71-883(+)
MTLLPASSRRDRIGKAWRPRSACARLGACEGPQTAPQDLKKDLKKTESEDVTPMANLSSSPADQEQLMEEPTLCDGMALHQAGDVGLRNFSSESDEDDQSHAKAFCESLSFVYLALTNLGAQSVAHHGDRVTGFHAQVEPKIGVHDYQCRLQQFFQCSESCHVMALIYIDRMVNLHSEITVTTRNIHRLLAVATVVSAKFLDDVYFSNAFYAKVCGLRVKELNQLETNFLMLLRWNLVVRPGEYDAYLRQIRLVFEARTSSRSGLEGDAA